MKLLVKGRKVVGIKEGIYTAQSPTSILQGSGRPGMGHINDPHPFQLKKSFVRIGERVKFSTKLSPSGTKFTYKR